MDNERNNGYIKQGLQKQELNRMKEDLNKKLQNIEIKKLQKDNVETKPIQTQIIVAYLITICKWLYIIMCSIIVAVYTKYIGLISKKDIKKDIPNAKDIVLYFPLIFEFYCMLFHCFVVRMWIFSNFLCTILYMYSTLSGSNQRNEGIPINKSRLKRISSGVVCYGCFLLLFFTRSIGVVTVPLMLYLINRTIRNVFGKGF
jgi:hypothetical protein